MWRSVWCLLIALRGEEGEINGRFHYHCLVGGTFSRNYHTLKHQAEWLWKIQCGGARIDVRQYDRSLAGADYVANTVTLSASVYRLIAEMDRVGERRCGQDTRKNGLVLKRLGVGLDEVGFEK